MVDKLKSLVQMSEFIAVNSTQTYENWTHFLQFSGRFYKYTYDEQISIYFQRPEATAVASYGINRCADISSAALWVSQSLTTAAMALAFATCSILQRPEQGRIPERRMSGR